MKMNKWVESSLLQFPLRVGLGGIFCLAAYTKLGDVQSFAEAIKGFQVVDVENYEHLIVFGAFTMPWVEMIAGVLLILGLWTRAGAAIVSLMLVLFMAALMHVIFDDSISADCSCFGDVKIGGCSSKVGWCQVIRDLVMLVPAVYLVWRGGGVFALDALLSRKTAPLKAQTPDAQFVSEQVDEGGFRG
ncbi:MAG: DoxX family protein [Phycisphaerales bacterium]|nr:DoxX family protein [Phycisphaerales bacterium]